jgi:hypothetical protein
LIIGITSGLHNQPRESWRHGPIGVAARSTRDNCSETVNSLDDTGRPKR